ncbi:Purine nucleoside phosphorylase [Mycena indigotica]|uniref:Structural maintenance of chromosomes protein 5 n=1 Tax=Mycena indigotica TaxID=2126181 RepID=A0A8H6T4M3_9AGAR|nr:Purine nucleoside phosphorylase [Mycena indigotica]KAF7312005.1 Purine nucleoside phosphorylase [Mycena indigotica]
MVRRGDSSDEDPAASQSQSVEESSQASTSRVKAEKHRSPRGAKRARVNEAGDDVVHEQDDEQDNQEEEGEGEEREASPPVRVKVKTLPRDVDGYIPGSIVRIKLHNFVTYDDVEFCPGPHLNMIFGPNGTGKSSIACAICLGLNWPPSVLGRASDLQSFVKLGTDSGSIEIELKGRAGEGNLVILRKINAKSRASTYLLNGSSATGGEITAKVAQLNVQVGNLCSFLPQDKVSSFAAMSPIGLLRETENAAGDDRMSQWHDMLIQDGKKLKTLTEAVEKDSTQMNQLQERNNQIERDVQRYKERKDIELKISILNIFIPVEQYREARIQWLALKAKKQILHNKAVRLKQKNEPAHQYLEQLEAEHASLDEQRNKSKRSIVAIFDKYKAALTKAGSMDDKLERFISDLDNVKKTEETRLQTIKNCEAQIKKFEKDLGEDVKPLGNEDELKAKHRSITVAFQQTGYDDKRHAWERKHNDIEESKRKNKRDEDMAQDGLRQLNSVSGRKLEAFAKWDQAGGDAVRWLRANKQLFRMEVFEPAFLSVTIPDQSYASQVETCFSNASMRMFVFQCQEDYNTFNQNTNDNQDFSQGGRRKVPTWFRPGADAAETNLSAPPLPREELLALGFDGYALDFVECPDGLKWYLQKDVGLHRIAISRRNFSPEKIVQATEAMMRSGGSSAFIEGMNSHQANRSHYGRREVMSSSTGIRPARNFTGNFQVDTQQKQRYEGQLQHCKEQRTLIEGDEAELRSEREELDAQKKQHEADLKEVDDQINEIRKMMRKRLDLESKLKRVRDTLAKAQKQGNAAQASAKIRKDLFNTATERQQLLAKVLSLAKDIVEAQKKATLCGLEFLQIGANKTAFKDLLDVKDAKYRAALDEFNKIDDQVKDLKEVAVKLKTASEDYLKNIPEDIRPKYEEVETARVNYQKAVADGEEPVEPESMGELIKAKTSADLEEVLETQQAKLEMNMNTNPGVVEQYERRKREIEGLASTIEVKEREVKKLERNVKRTRDQWEPALRSLVASIGKKFSAAFDRIGCAGEIRIREDEAYDQWAIDILVKFRDTEKLQILTAHRQSGGERSLTTILYLMSLTEEARAPFSLVDEINQGMDQRAERMVHNSMVEVTCKADSAQYFLITPKLLPDLEYHERMKVLCVNNGEWLPRGRRDGEHDEHARRTDLLARPRSLNREWRGFNKKSTLPKYDSLPRLRLVPTGQRPIFTCPSPECGLTHFFADLPVCPWCRARSAAAEHAYRRSTPRPRTRSAVFVRWRVDDEQTESKRRRQTVSGTPLAAAPAVPGRPRAHHRSHSTPVDAVHHAQLVRHKREPIYNALRRNGGWQSPQSMSSALSSPTPSLSPSLTLAVNTGSMSMPASPVSDGFHGQSLLFSTQGEEQPRPSFSSADPDLDESFALVDIGGGSRSGSDSQHSATFFAFAPPPAPLPFSDDDGASDFGPPPGRRRGSIAGLLGSLTTRHKEAEKRAQLAATVKENVNHHTAGGLHTLRKLIRRRWTVTSR